MKIYYFLPILLVAMILGSCSQSSQIPSGILTPALIGTASATVSPIKTALPTSSLPINTQTSSNQPTQPSLRPTINSWMKLENQCLEIGSTLPNSFNGVGNIILGAADGFENLDMKTGKRSAFPNGFSYSTWQLSIGGKWLAYHNLDDPYTIQILDRKGVLQNTIHLEKGSSFSGWQDDEHIMISKIVPNLEEGVHLYSLIILNPFEGTSREFPPDFQDIYPYPTKYIKITYNKDLTRVVYPYIRKGGATGFVLQDVSTGKILADLPENTIDMSYIGQPLWSPDSEQVLVVGAPDSYENQQHELFIINRDGNKDQVTDAKSYDVFIELNSYSWSPDGKSIALWLRFGQKNQVSQLAVLNVDDRKITNYCIPGTSPVGRPPIWSPDSNQILVNFSGKVKSNIQESVIVDIKKNQAVSLGQGAPYAWLDSVPEAWYK